MADFLDGLRASAAAALFPEEGELHLDGLDGSVEVLRDRWGVAYVSAGSLDDLWFAQGAVTAGERLFQVDLALRQANGRLSELFGERTIGDDRFVRTVGINRAGARIAAGWDETSRRMYARFRAGIRAWMASMPALPVEYELLDVVPDLPDDDASWAACWAMFSWALSGNWDLELLRAHLAEQLGEEAAGRLLPPLEGYPAAPAAVRLAGDLLRDLPRPPRGQGSNAWAIAGARTESGAPLLANDPHLLVQQPGAWLELHLRAPGYEARGVAAPFAAGIVLGTTAHHAWGATNVCGDVQDLYVERLDDDGRAARYGDAWEPLTVHREEIAVRGEAEPSIHEVLETRHGPLLDAYLTGRLRPEKHPLETPYALRWVGAEHSIQPSALLEVANVTSFEGFRAAARALECPGQNLVYADVDGTIGYQCTGLHPIRRAGDGSVPVPGWTDEHEWEGFVPFDELPWAIDPGRGYLVTANDRVHAEDFPHHLGNDFHAPDRAARIRTLLEDGHGHSVASCRAIQNDTISRSAEALLPRLALPDGPAASLLRGWDHDLAAGSAAASLWEVFVDELARRAVDGKEPLVTEYLTDRELFRCRALPALLADGAIPSEQLSDALTTAWDRCAEIMGPDPTTWRWGDIHRARFAHPLGRLPGLEPLFVAAELPLGGDDQTVCNAGFEGDGPFDVSVVPSWRAVYDLGDLDRSLGILPTGQSGNPSSPHWSDQAEAWAAGDLRPLPFTRPAVEAAATATLTISPA
ncbi:MAG TPA: penicillin acylase family protein [Actinomycetota bacterium]|nr:penicillin acylase family protein [Actinomycetota bacterium]